MRVEREVVQLLGLRGPWQAKCAGTWTASVAGVMALSESFLKPLVAGDQKASLSVFLCSSVKQIEAPYVFDWENAIAMHAMQGNRASSRGEGEVSWISSSCGRQDRKSVV